jgi:hypothetical protein
MQKQRRLLRIFSLRHAVVWDVRVATEKHQMLEGDYIQPAKTMAESSTALTAESLQAVVRD